MSEYMYDEAVAKGKKVYGAKKEVAKKIKYKHQGKAISRAGRDKNYPKHFFLGGSTSKAHIAERRKYGEDYNDMSGATSVDR